MTSLFTWLTEDLTNAELGLDGYNIFRHGRNPYTCDSRRGGGVLMTLKNVLCPNPVISPNVDV